MKKLGYDGNDNDNDDGWEGLGGILLSPIVDLLCSLGDLVINFLQWGITGNFVKIGTGGVLNTFLINKEDFVKAGGGKSVTSSSVDI